MALHLEKGWYGAVTPLISTIIYTACGKRVPVEEITRSWAQVDCPQCEEQLERLDDDSEKG